MEGSESSLEEQLIGPLYADNEMGKRRDQLIADLRSHAIYRDLFKVAFGPGRIECDHVFTVITAFKSSLVLLNSRYDFYAHGLRTALLPSVRSGLEGFRSSVHSFLAVMNIIHHPYLVIRRSPSSVNLNPRGDPLIREPKQPLARQTNAGDLEF